MVLILIYKRVWCVFRRMGVVGESVYPGVLDLQLPFSV